MHIPDAVLDPKVAAATSLLARGGPGVRAPALRGSLRERTTVLMGSMAAFVFAAQMVNFPLLVVPASGHLLGGVLAAVLLGPWAGSLVIAAVLLVQCFLFGDGGLTALGANFVNMGLIGSVGRLRDLRPDPAGDRRAAGGPGRGDGGGLVLGDPGLGGVRGRAGGVGPGVRRSAGSWAG